MLYIHIFFSLMFRRKLILEKKNSTVTQWQDIYFHVPRVYQNKGQKVCAVVKQTERFQCTYSWHYFRLCLQLAFKRCLLNLINKQMLYQYGPFLIQDLSTQPEKTCTLQKLSAFWPESSILFGPFTVKKVWINFVGKSCQLPSKNLEMNIGDGGIRMP